MRVRGVSLGRLLLALDATLVQLVESPRGLDIPVASAALIDSDDVRLGLAAGAGSADVFFLLGVDDAEAVRWIERHAGAPAAVFVKDPGGTLIARASAAGIATVSVDPRARWERLYRLVDHVFEHHGDRDDSWHDSGTDLFALAQSVADRVHGMVSIEDAQSHVLAYSASNDEADELRRLSILGRAGPPEHLEWLSQWGIFDALRAGDDVVPVAARPELGLQPRLAIGIHRAAVDQRRAPEFLGSIWLQQGSRPLSEDADSVLRGAAVLAARIMSRLVTIPSAHTLRAQELLGLTEGEVDVAAVARELGVVADGRVAVIGFDTAAEHRRLAHALALSASAFRRDSLVVSNGSRVYVLLPQTNRTAAVSSWLRGTITTLHAELGLPLRAVIAAPVAGLGAAASARSEVDRVLDSAERHPVAFGEVTSVAEARTAVLVDEIVTMVGASKRLLDPRVRELRDHEPVLAETLQAYLDGFGDVAAVAARLHVHANTVRYRVRRAEQLLSTSLSDPDVRLLLSLSLRATA